MKDTSEMTIGKQIDKFLGILKSDGLDIRPMDTDDRYLVTDDKDQDIAISIVTIFESQDTNRLSLGFDQLINFPEVELSKRVLDLWKKFVETYYLD